MVDGVNGALLGYVPQAVEEARKFGLGNVTIQLHEMEELRAEDRLVILLIVCQSRVKVFKTTNWRLAHFID